MNNKIELCCGRKSCPTAEMDAKGNLIISEGNSRITMNSEQAEMLFDWLLIEDPLGEEAEADMKC